MCAICGCSSTDFNLSDPGKDHVHEAPAYSEFIPHEHENKVPHPANGAQTLSILHVHAHSHLDEHQEASNGAASTPLHGTSKHLTLEENILAKNDRIAQSVRAWLKSRKIFAVNLMSSPGSGKTTLLERSLRDLLPQTYIQVVEGDQETENDALRIRNTGAPVVQINTGAGCHLDAHMFSHALEALKPRPSSMVMVENVGNLVCPALFYLGENKRVVILSVTEGDDKPLKYPHMFRSSDLLLINKMDLLPYVNFDLEKCAAYARQINPKIQIIKLSATRGEGMAEWYAWLQAQTTTLAQAQLEPLGAELRP